MVRLKSVGNFLKAMDQLFYELAFTFAIFQEKCLYSDILLLQRKKERLYIYTGIDMGPFSIVLFNKEPFKNLAFFLFTWVHVYQFHF